MITIKKKKDPESKLDYLFRWVSELEPLGDTIASFQIVADEGVTIVSSSNTDTDVTVWISGGTLWKRYVITCRITTAAGRIYDKSFYLYIEQL